MQQLAEALERILILENQKSQAMAALTRETLRRVVAEERVKYLEEKTKAER